MTLLARLILCALILILMVYLIGTVSGWALLLLVVVLLVLVL